MNTERTKASLIGSLKMISRMWGYVKEWRFRFFFGFIVGCFQPLYFTLISSLAWKKCMEIVKDKDMEQFVTAIITIGILFLIGTAVFPLCFGFIYTTYSKACGKLHKEIFLHAQKLPVTYMEDNQTGDILTKIMWDFGDAVQLFGYPTVGQDNPFAKVITVTVTAIIVLVCNWQLGLASLLIGMLSLLITLRFANPIKKVEEEIKVNSGKMAQGVVNTLSGIAVSRMFRLDTYLKKQYQENTEAIYQNNMSILGKKSILYAVSNLQGFLSFTCVTAVGLLLAYRKVIDMPMVMFIANLQMGMANGLVQIGKTFSEMQKYIVGAERICSFLDMEEEQETEDKEEPDLTTQQAIKIINLNFSYEDGKKQIFNNFNLEVGQGEKLAICGGSGGGKSTLFKLLLQFAKPQGGSIELFGHLYQDYSLKHLRGLFSYVPQNNYLFDASIEENIAWGCPGCTKEQIIEAAKDANIHEFILTLPEGYDTRVGEKGAQLSGGQRQRIAIARAFMKKAQIILLDEATSSLDSESEKEVQKALERLMEGRTSIIIAHRLSTIKQVDRILVLEHGQVVEEGTHDELVEKDGRYAQLNQMQMV